jgi:hypothetical protein
MAAKKRRAQTLSLADLSKAVDRSVALAAKRHEVTAEPGNLLMNWQIFGRLLREFEDLNGALSFAKDVTRGLKVQGLKAEPVVLKVGPDVLCGFIERGQLPQLIAR